MDTRTLIVYRDKETLAQASAQRTLLTILDLLNERDERDTRQPRHERLDVALTGGSDTVRALRYMADNPLVDGIAWNRVHIWWGDERFVAAGADDRNALQARRALLDTLIAQGLLPESNVHEMPADTRTEEEMAKASDADNDALLEAAAQGYERELITHLGTEPMMDLSVLGMGPDGHYASLFPGHQEITITDRLVVGVNHSPKLPPLRLSMTAPLLARSRRTWFLTAGSGKADALAHVFASPDNPEYPASFARGTEAFIWFTTADAVAKAR